MESAVNGWPARLYLWVAIGHQDSPPDRVQVVICEHCAALVAVERADLHARHHRAVGC
jgi:hypothetical protein